jgi:hypothetical protein
MTIFDALKRDHEGVRAGLADVERASDSDILAARFGALHALLLAHMRAEEDTFYAALEAIDETEERAEAAVDEHDAVEAMLAELGALEIGSAAWRAAFDAMRTALLKHFAEEERALFRAARGVLDETTLERLADAFLAERQRLLDGAAPALAQKSA